jgi:hypothetical protein
LHDLIKTRSKEGLQAVAEMSKRQLSFEQRLNIIKANNSRISFANIFF